MNKNTKIVAIVAILIAVVGLAVGFAAFSSSLTISSSATVTPSADTFKVVFGEEGTVPTSGPYTVIKDASYDFTAPGQTKSTRYYIYNIGEYTAYLNSVTFSKESPTCEATVDGGATASLVSDACEGISMSLEYLDMTNLSSKKFTATDADVDGISLAKATNPNIKGIATLTVTYAKNAARADGAFTVDCGSIALNFGSTD